MSSLNQATLIGRLGQDPEVGSTTSGRSYCNLSVATNRAWTTKSGEKKEQTEWHRVVVFGKQADNCGKYLSKGSQVSVVGRIQTRSWTTDSGEKRYSTEIVAFRVLFLSGGGGNGDGRRNSPPPPSDDYAPRGGTSGGGGGFDDDEIPF
jgi:single-strand DNA-binding protein